MLSSCSIGLYVVGDGGKKLSETLFFTKWRNMGWFEIPMRPTFPSDKITYNISGMIGKLGGKVRNIMFYFSENRTFDIELFLEDSERYSHLLIHLKMII